ncbi:MAG: hypothetical protein ABI977_16190 [Acidobacteriota bacterium]
MNQAFWRQAFKLAHYIHGDVRVAFCVLVHGMELMSLKAKQQKERKGTNLMDLSEAQLFQVGLLEASEFYEKRQEREQFGLGGQAQCGEARQSLLELLIELAFSAEAVGRGRAAQPLTEEDLVVRYIKHLVLVTVSRNAYQVMVGISLFLYRHGPKQMARIHECVDRKRSRGGENETVYKEARERLWEAMIERFGEMLVLRNDKRFEVQIGTMPLIALINDCLNHLALWDATCGQFQDEPHQAHALIHPACYEKIIRQLQIKDPTGNLAIPQFRLPPGNNNHTPRPDRQPPDLTAEQIRLLDQVCDKLGRRRKESEPVLLLVVVDGVEQARFDPRAHKTVACRVKAGARIIEVYSREADGDLLLAACWLAELAEGEERVTAQTRAEGGQAVRFEIAFAEDGAALVEISYRETKPIRWLALEWQRLAYRSGRLANVPKPVFVSAALVMGVLGLLLFFWLRRPNESPRVVRRPAPAVEPTVRPSLSPSPTMSPLPERPKAKDRPSPPALAHRRSSAKSKPEITIAELDARKGMRRVTGVPLRSVARIHVQSLGKDQFSRNLREGLIEQFRQSQFTVEEQISTTTDAVVERAVSRAKRQITLRLVNRAGEVLWQVRFKNPDRQQIEQITQQAVKALAEAVEAEKRKPQQ